MSRLDLVYGFRRIPAKCRFGASLGRGRAFRRTAVTSARRPCACRTLAASGRSGALDDLRRERRPVTPEVAGSSPVATASTYPHEWQGWRLLHRENAPSPAP